MPGANAKDAVPHHHQRLRLHTSTEIVMHGMGNHSKVYKHGALRKDPLLHNTGTEVTPKKLHTAFVSANTKVNANLALTA